MFQIQSESPAVSQYQYTPLSPKSREVRLLTLRSGNWDDEIQCVTQVVSLDLSPVYEAISYAWGSSKDTKAIFVDGYKVHVKINLESVLRHLRRPTQPLSLWVDALCIDQENVTEKTHQVSMMGEIYSGCSRVYIWLGNQFSHISLETSLTPSKRKHTSLL